MTESRCGIEHELSLGFGLEHRLWHRSASILSRHRRWGVKKKPQIGKSRSGHPVLLEEFEFGDLQERCG
jgi:hypothetical protein